MKPILLFAGLTFFFLQPLLAQQQDDKDRKVKLDSLERAFFSAGEDTVKRNRLEDLMNFYAEDSATTPEESFRQLQLLVEKKGDPKLNYLLLLFRVYITHTNDSIVESRKYLNEFLAQCQRQNDKSRRYADALMRLSQMESYGNDYDDALRHLLNALDFARDTLKDKEMVAGAYMTLAILYYEQRDTLKAIEFNKKALAEETEINNLGNMAAVSHNLALEYRDLGQYDSAKFYFRESIRLFNLDVKDAKLRLPFINLGEVFRLTHQYDSAIFYVRNAISNAIAINDESSLGFGYLQIAITFRDVGKPDSAGKYFKLAKENMERVQPQTSLILLYPDLAGFYASQGKHKLAYEYLKKAVAIKDMVFNAENNKVLKEMDAKYQAGRKEQEILKQEEQIKRQRILNYSMIAIASFFLLLIFFIYRSNRLKQKSNKLMAVAKEKAEQSEKFKQQFLANMSHEIRTPMNAVMGMTDLLIEKNPRSDQFNYLDGIKNSSATLLYIINDILDISKIEAGKIELEQIDFSIHEVVSQVKQTLHHKADESGIQLVTDVGSKIPEVVIGDPVRLNQVLMNLTGNAIKFTEKGSVTVEVKQGGSGIKFSIIDTGVGIPAEKLQSVFESFTQAHSSDTRRFGGTGLGLSISKQLVELMGGKIFIESEVGSGSIFSFEINYTVGSAEKMQEQKSSEQVDGSILNGLKILLTDDNEYNRMVVRDTLKSKASVEITEAVNGEDALEKFGQKEFDVILMDVQMPVMDGYEATRNIRKNFTAPKNQVPVIALTASVIRGDLDKCKLAGMTDYVSKPFKASQLISAIAKATGREIKFLDRKHIEVKNRIETGNGAFDLSYLEEFCEGDKVRIKKYVNIFLESATVLTGKINGALKENNFDDIANQVHAYKTKWIMMGMDEAKELAAVIELQCRKETPDHASINSNTLKLIAFVEQAAVELRQKNNNV